ncbi:hypothetical protein [Bowmanella dokdonensis]|uniref:Uncharacterized protein n=1 Tax=Bowmanella dokdonensis TaxID=751969 RepID=A0A939DL71_9ALTE|nr:hypothetical protein [Bowmanella dokdonensis]MBN7824763.1 hypothetical protein [Bowmanella dokdonensis]
MNFVVTGRRSAVQVQALQDCVEIVEEVLSELGRSLTPLQKAKVLTVLYEEYLEDSDSITPERIVRHLRLVA